MEERMQKKADLSGKRIVVTGGSMGIGLACVETCLEAGGKVLICARTEGPLDQAAASLKNKGYSDIETKVADVTHQEQMNGVLQAAITRFGGLDGVIHCAGVYGPIGAVTEVDPSEWLEAITINLFGTFLVARQACQILKHRGGGRIVLFSGGGAAAPFPNYTAYACGKVGVVRLTETLAQEMQPFNIQVNCVAPGFVITRLHQQTLVAGERAGKAFLENTRQQIETGGVPASVGARAAAFLLSDESKGITGKFVAAPYDGWADWPKHLDVIEKTDVFTLRRIVPKDRGMDWQ
jgi:NAD(P)-dependent dehydrogenase (short-subunit alcohol dehydrogenase family)